MRGDEKVEGGEVGKRLGTYDPAGTPGALAQYSVRGAREESASEPVGIATLRLVDNERRKERNRLRESM